MPISLNSGLADGTQDSLLVRSMTSTGGSAGTLTLPANAYIDQIIVRNTTANAVTGGIKFGTSAGGVDIVATLAVGANALTNVLDAALLKRVFGPAQTIYYDAVVAWNNANVVVTVVYVQL